MHAQNAVINQGSHWQTVKTIDKEFPKFDIVSSFAFVMKELHSS